LISRLTGDPVLRTIAVVTALYFAQSLLLPVVLAFLLSLALTPVVDRLHAWGVKRSLAVLLSVLLTLGAAGGLGWLVTGQLVGLAKSLPAHRERILARTESLGPLGRAMREAYARFQATVQSGVPATGEDQGKETPPREKPPEAAAPRGGEPMGSSEIAQTLKSVVTALAGTLGNFFIVMVLVLLFLGSQEDLRDRGLKLFQERGLKVNRAQFSEIGDKISKYLISEVVVNAAYGGLVGVAMVVLGVEQPLFWGLLAFLFRFIPYIGIWLVATLTFLLSLATTDAWGKPLGLLAFWVVLEVATANLVELRVYGRRTRITTLGVMLSALFWSWLWGVVGLILATPMTASLAVFGARVPGLRWLHLLIAVEPVGEPPEVEPTP